MYTFDPYLELSVNQNIYSYLELEKNVEKDLYLVDKLNKRIFVDRIDRNK